MIRRRLQTRWKLLARKLFHHHDPADRIARGISAGFFAAAFPLPGLQIPLSLLFAYLARGNRAVAILPQFLANAGTLFPLAIGEFYLGAWLWPGAAPDPDAALAGTRLALDAWSWSEPWRSTQAVLDALGELGLDAAGPILLGAVLVGAALALVMYPLALWGVRAWRKRRGAASAEEPELGPFELPVPDKALTPAQAIERYAGRPERFQRAESIRLLVDGREAYPEMLAAIEAARETVDLETYILRADAAGERFAAALRKAALQGARVRLLYDAVGALGLPERYVHGLLDAGVHVAVYHPLHVSRPLWAWNKRDHRKILVVDGRTAFAGGLNLAADYLPKEEGGAGWRDTHARIDGREAAGELSRLFERTWKRARKWPGVAQRRQESMPRRVVGHTAALGPGVPVQVIGNSLFRQRWLIRRAYLRAIQQARNYILIENAYFIPDRGIRKALYQAVERGVRVGVVVARESDVELAAAAARALYAELLERGVRIFEWPGSMLHAKTAVIDDAFALVGSYNLDHRSLFHNLEAVVVTPDAAFARRLREQTMDDIARCEELTPARHEARSLSTILFESFAYQLRYWL